MINYWWKAALACALLLSGGSAIASSKEAQQEYDEALKLTPNLDNGRKVYKICAVCHEPEGWGHENGHYPQIAGQLNSVIIKQLADIRARNRDNPTMLPFTSSSLLGGVQEIADVAAYVSQLPMTTGNGKGPGNDLEHGKRLYEENCTECHGDHGQGDREDHIPAIYAQHYQYLVRQFEWIKSGRRRNADPKMVQQVRGFHHKDVLAVMDYVSRLQPPKGKLAAPDWRNPDFPNYSRKPRVGTGYTIDQRPEKSPR
jgi:cytochrome c553